MKLPVHLDILLFHDSNETPAAGPVSGEGPWRAVVPGTIHENRIEGRGDTPEAAMGGAHAVATSLMRRDDRGRQRQYCPGIELEIHFHVKKMKLPGRPGESEPQETPAP